MTEVLTRPVFHTPQRSYNQRMDALKRANDIRVKRAAMKVEMKNGERSGADILRNPPEYVGTMKVMDLLLAVPKLGRVKANRILVQCRISQAKTVSGLSERQRAELIKLLTRSDNGME